MTSQFPADVHLIETMRLDPGREIRLLELHLVRLCRSAMALGIPYSEQDIQTALAQALAAAPANQTARVRLLLATDGHPVVTVARLAPTPEPVAVALSRRRLCADWIWLHHKTTCRPLYEEAARWLEQHPPVFDLLFLNEQGELCEGSRSSVYVKDDRDRWLTPPLRCGVLPGVMRRHLLDTHQVSEACLTENDLRQAQQLRLSNALRGWLDARLDDSLVHF
jgi:4-amino-4-deoxychorismate lyase